MRQNNFRIFKERSSSREPARSHACIARGAYVAARPEPRKVGGASRDRTGDLLLAKQALSQLSYGP